MLPSPVFYNAIAHVYEAYCESSNINEYLEQEINLVASYKPASILEFGIGNGRFAKEYLKRNADVYYVGVDNAEEMLLHAEHSKAILVLADGKDYLKQLIVERKKFDCIVAPYTAIHHIKTNEQLELFECIKQVADVLIINCLSEVEEKVFADSDMVAVTVNLPGETFATTTIHKLHPKIREQTFKVTESMYRDFLIYDAHVSLT